MQIIKKYGLKILQKSSIQLNNSEILEDKKKHFIQVYANDRDNGKKAELYK